MQIKTSLFGIKRNEYFGILTRKFFKKHLWSYLIALAVLIFECVSIVFWGKSITKIAIIYVVLITFVTLYYLLRIWNYTVNKKNEKFYQDRVIEMTDDFLEIVLDDDSSSKILWSNILYYRKIKGNFLLYTSKHQFAYIPKRAFLSDNDYKIFENFVSEKTNTKQAIEK